MRATYNITNDKLKVWFDDRLSKEDYDRMRRAGFVFWHGSKCFCAKWSPTAEDLARELGIESIEADDTPDDVEARVERFSGYAENAEQSAQSSQEYLDERANTERRRKNAINGIERNLELAQHWQERIQGAIRHAQYQERPDVIARRIRGLESDKRCAERDMVIDPKVKPDTDRDGVTRYWVGHSRGGHWTTLEELERVKPRLQRWIAHYERRLEYERARLVAAGGAPEVLRPERKKAVQPKGVQPIRSGGIPEELGAAGFYPGFSRSGELRWCLITKVNRRTVEVLHVETVINAEGKPRRRFLAGKKDIYGIDALKTRKEVQSEMPQLHEEYEDMQKLVARIEEAKAAKAAERAVEYERLDAVRAAAGASSINATTGELAA